MRCSGVRRVRVERVLRVLGELRQGAAHAHAAVPHAAEGAGVRLRPPARLQGDVRRRRARVRVSASK